MINTIFRDTTRSEISGTVRMFRHYRAFQASLPRYMKSLKGPCAYFADTLDKPQAQRELRSMVEVAINRRAGIGSAGRKDCREYQIKLRRDQQALQAIRRIRLRVYQFETAEVRSRFSHLLARYDD